MRLSQGFFFARLAGAPFSNRMAYMPDDFAHPFEAIKPPSDLSPPGLRAWLWRICRLVNVTPTELARTAAIAPSTVNKFLLDRDANPKRSLSARTLAALQKAALKVYADTLGQDYYLNSESAPGGFQIATVAVKSELRAFAFGLDIWPLKRQFFIQVPIPNSLSGLRFGGFAVTDDHAEQAFPYATILVATPFEIDRDTIEFAEFLIVERMNEEGKSELTVRRFTVSPSGDMWLTSQSRRGDRLTDVYAGKTNLDWAEKPPKDMKFKLTPHPDYTVRFRVISAIQPVAFDFAAIKFPE